MRSGGVEWRVLMKSCGKLMIRKIPPFDLWCATNNNISYKSSWAGVPYGIIFSSRTCPKWNNAIIHFLQTTWHYNSQKHIYKRLIGQRKQLLHLSHSIIFGFIRHNSMYKNVKCNLKILCCTVSAFIWRNAFCLRGKNHL